MFPSRCGKGFSLVEATIAAFFLAVILGGMMVFMGQTGQTSVDAQYELLAFQAAREPIEVFRAFGYKWLKANYLDGDRGLKMYPKGSSSLGKLDPVGVKYPGEAGDFLREILVEPSAGGNAIKLTVRVSPGTQSKAGAMWKGKKSVELRALIIGDTGR